MFSEEDLTTINTILPNRQVVDLIPTSKNLNQLNLLLNIQANKRIDDCETLINVPLDFIYTDDEENIDLQVEVFKKVILLTKDSEIYLRPATEWLVKKIDINLKHIKLLNCLYENYKNDDKTIYDLLRLLDIDKVLLIFKKYSQDKQIYKFMLAKFLPNYLDFNAKQLNHHEKLFDYIATTNQIEILCAVYRKMIFLQLDSNNTFNLILKNKYWELIMNSLTKPSTQKPALFLLMKSTDFQCSNPEILPNYIRHSLPEDQMATIWRNYCVLIDVSNEKPLFVIQPSLQLFNSITPLHYKWRLCLYKTFLDHSQNYIVFWTATFVLKQLNWDEFKEIAPEFLLAINKHEHCAVSQAAFKEMGNFVQKLDHTQAEMFFKLIFQVTWTPVAIWSVLNNFCTSKLFISVELLEIVVDKLTSLPNVFVRNACISLILQQFIAHYTYATNDDLIKLLVILFEHNNEDMFRNLIDKYKDNLLFTLESADLIELVKTNAAVWLNIFQQLGVKRKMDFDPKNEQSDKLLLAFHEVYSEREVEDYILDRIDKLTNDESVDDLIKLSWKLSSGKIAEKCKEIVSLNGSNFTQNITQQLVALCNDSKLNANHNLINISFDKADNPFVINQTKLLLLIFLKNYKKDDDLTKASIEFLREIIETNNFCLKIVLKHLLHFIQLNDSFANHFCSFCLTEYFELPRNNELKSITADFFDVLLQDAHFELNPCWSDNIVLFTKNVLEITATTSLLTCIVAKAVWKYVNHGKLGEKFVDIIADLILYGGKVRKNERVEYQIYQEISEKLANLERCASFSPNIEELTVRFYSLDAMLSLTTNNTQVADNFARIFIRVYKTQLKKRLFPGSELFLHKLRLIQALLLIHPFLQTEKNNLIQLLSESLADETHQLSVKHLMQWLYIRMIENDQQILNFITDNLQLINTSTNSSTCLTFIPILYHYTLLYHPQKMWAQTVDVLLPCTMGAQFKLRVYAQVALIKLYERAKERNFGTFTENYKFLYDSLKKTLESSSTSLKSVSGIDLDFLDYFSMEGVRDYSTIYYEIPKRTQVVESEWENLAKLSKCAQLTNVRFNHAESSILVAKQIEFDDCVSNNNIQRKISPWINMFEEIEQDQPKNNLIFVTSLVEKPTNLGGLTRTSEVFGVKTLVMKTAKITSDKEFKSLSLSSQNWMDIKEVKIEDLKPFLHLCKSNGFCLVGAEQTSDSVKLNNFKFPKNTVLVLGNEREGISPDLIPLLDHCVEIPQTGQIRSLNVHVAGAIMIWEYFKQNQI